MEEKDGITLSELVDALLKRWYIIVITVVLGVIATGVLAFVVVKPKYKSTVEIMVQPPQTANGFDLNVANKIMETVAEHFQTDLVLEKVVTELDSPHITVKSIRDGLNVTYKTTMFYMKISYTHTDNIISQTIAQEVVKIGEEMANNGTVPLLQDSFIIISNAKKGVYVSPNKTLYLLVGFLIGALVGATLAFVLEFARYTYKDKDNIEADLNIQIIGVIPEHTIIDKKEKKHQKERGKNYENL